MRASITIVRRSYARKGRVFLAAFCGLLLVVAAPPGWATSLDNEPNSDPAQPAGPVSPGVTYNGTLTPGSGPAQDLADTYWGFGRAYASVVANVTNQSTGPGCDLWAQGATVRPGATAAVRVADRLDFGEWTFSMNVSPLCPGPIPYTFDVGPAKSIAIADELSARPSGRATWMGDFQSLQALVQCNQKCFLTPTVAIKIAGDPTYRSTGPEVVTDRKAYVENPVPVWFAVSRKLQDHLDAAYHDGRAIRAELTYRARSARGTSVQHSTPLRAATVPSGQPSGIPYRGRSSDGLRISFLRDGNTVKRLLISVNDPAYPGNRGHRAVFLARRGIARTPTGARPVVLGPTMQRVAMEMQFQGCLVTFDCDLAPRVWSDAVASIRAEGSVVRGEIRVRSRRPPRWTWTTRVTHFVARPAP